MEIDVVDIRWLNMGLRQRSLHRKRGAQPLRMWCRHVMGVATLATSEELHDGTVSAGRGTLDKRKASGFTDREPVAPCVSWATWQGGQQLERMKSAQ